jgi:hypothetical protein
MKVLDLFAGTRSVSKAFEERGHESFSIELDKRHQNIDWYVDILEITAEDILERFGRPDVIWASPPCTSYSIAGISHHRRRNPHTGELEPFSKFAELSDRLTQHVIKLIEELKPSYYFIENPRGGMRKMKFMQHLPMYTITYCQYGENRQKPTDIWTNHPNPQFKPACIQGSPCHEATPSGSKNGTQGLKNAMLRSIIPHDLCLHIAKICEEGEYGEIKQGTTLLPQVETR